MPIAVFAFVAALTAASAAPQAGAAHARAPDLGRTDWEPDCGLTRREDPAFRDAAWAQRGRSEPLCLFAGAMAWASHDKGKAQQLYALALTRRRYDIGRCVWPPQDQFSSMMAVMRMAADQALAERGLRVGPDEISAVARDEATYAYRTDHLNRMCGGQVKPVSQWPAVRRQMLSELNRRPSAGRP